MYRDRRITALVPCYNEALNIRLVIETMPDFVDYIIVVNDGSTDETADVVNLYLEGESADRERVIFIDRVENKGLGYTLIEAHKYALTTDADVMVIMAGDGQMLPKYLPTLLDVLIDGGYDFVKGNRFFNSDSFKGMPKYRIFGNVILTFMTKLATGYWSIFDPQNGYTAITRDMSLQVNWDEVAQDYSFENCLLAQLWLHRARIKDVNIPAHYGNETSTISLAKTVPHLLKTLRKAFRRRVWRLYVLQSFSPVVIFGLGGLFFLTFGVLFGAWSMWLVWGVAPVSAAKAVFSAISIMTGIMMLLAAMVLDILNEPK